MESRWSQNSPAVGEYPLGSLLRCQPLRCGMCVRMEMQGWIMGVFRVSARHVSLSSIKNLCWNFWALMLQWRPKATGRHSKCHIPSLNVLPWEIQELRTLQQTWFIFKSPWLHNQWLFYVSSEDEEACKCCKSRKPAKPILQKDIILSKDLKVIPSKISNIKLFLAE